tara:strand:+ start:81815 stop:82036 length:222 start_codon:yes stop_codon:yes gene_type:complete
MRILVLIAIGLLLYVIIGNMLRRSRRSTPSSSSNTTTEKMVKCKQCGLHILEQEAIRNGENYYCSHEHLEADS